MSAGWQKRGVLFLFLVVAFWGLAVPEALPAEFWKAGVARVKITPQEFMWMAGYASRTKPAEGTHADLWARALVLEDAGGKRGVLISLDLVGIDRPLSSDLRNTRGAT